MNENSRSIGTRIYRLVATTVVIAMAILALTLAAYQLRANLDARESELTATSYVYAAAISDHFVQHDVPAIQNVFHSINHLHDVVGVYALDEQGHVLANAGNLAVLSSNMTSGEPSTLQMLTRGLMPVGVDVVRGGTKVGRLVMIGNISNVQHQILVTLEVIALSAISALVFALLLAKRLQRRISQPIIELTSSILALRKAHRYEPTVIANAVGETQALVESFNGMIGEIHSRDAALKKLAYFDPLTGLPNRASFQQVLSDHFKDNSKADDGCAILFLDIDNFKTINDTLGQVIGDALLLDVAAQLSDAKGLVAASEVLVARLGGDEFGIFVTGIHSAEEARANLAPFIACLYKPLRIAGNHLHVSACAGLAHAPEFGPTAEILQRNASLALSRAKREGVGRVISYRHEIGESIDKDAKLERALHNAIAANELEAHYQPIVGTADNEVQGFEALLRWRRADGSLVPPTKFIPLAEKSGCIAELGDWVLRRACLDAKAWMDAGEPPRFVSVNVSPSQLLLSDFIRTILDALDAAKLPPQLLCVELTESLFVGKSINVVRKLLLELRALGVTTALDDFGTGYSSLSYLEHLSFDKLKIDRAFIHNSDVTGGHKPLLQGIANLAHALNISIVAEGAETASEVEYLRKIGVQAIQGYYFAKPMPATQVLTWVQNRKSADTVNVTHAC